MMTVRKKREGGRAKPWKKKVEPNLGEKKHRRRFRDRGVGFDLELRIS